LTVAPSEQTIESMVVINIATLASLTQLAPEQSQLKNVHFPGGGGGVENLPFLQTNANTATVFATFWVEKIKGPTPDTAFMQPT
jgi:hypothetical protein